MSVLSAIEPVETPTRLRPHALRLFWCILFFAFYICLIVCLQTETARRATAPPWYSWTKLPAARTRLAALWLLPPAAVYAALLIAMRRLAKRRSIGWVLLPLAVTVVFAMNAATAMMDGGVAAIAAPFNHPGHEYFSDVAQVHGVWSWLHDYVARLPYYAIHTRTHPPGAVLLLYLVSRWIGPGVGVAAWAAVAITATAVAPAFLLARRIYGRETALLFLGLYAVTPNLVLFGATSMDGVFLTAILWSLYLLHRAIEEPGWHWGVLAGISVSVSLMLTFATVGILVLIGIYAALRMIERFSPVSGNRYILRETDSHAMGRGSINLLLCAIVTLGIFIGINWLTGFNLLSCLQASRHSDHHVMRTFQLSPGRYLDISFSNLFAFLIGIGFVTVTLWWRFLQRLIQKWNDASLWRASELLQLAAVITIVGLSFAGLFTHETERIWLFFAPLPLMAVAKLIAEDNDREKLLEWAMGGLFLQTWLCQIFLFTMW